MSWGQPRLYGSSKLVSVYSTKYNLKIFFFILNTRGKDFFYRKGTPEKKLSVSFMWHVQLSTEGIKRSHIAPCCHVTCPPSVKKHSNTSANLPWSCLLPAPYSVQHGWPFVGKPVSRSQPAHCLWPPAWLEQGRAFQLLFLFQQPQEIHSWLEPALVEPDSLSYGQSYYWEVLGGSGWS